MAVAIRKTNDLSYIILKIRFPKQKEVLFQWVLLVQMPSFKCSYL